MERLECSIYVYIDTLDTFNLEGVFIMGYESNRSGMERFLWLKNVKDR